MFNFDLQGAARWGMDALTGGQFSKAERGLTDAIANAPKRFGDAGEQLMKTAESATKMGLSTLAKPLDQISPGTVDRVGLRPAANAGQTAQPRPYAQGSTAASYAQALADRAKEMAALRSQFEETYKTNPYGDDYRRKLWGGATGLAQNQWVEHGRRHGQNLAARGLTNAGQSGLVDNELARFDLKRQVALGQVSNDANLQATNMASQWDSERARALDAFNLAQSQGSVSAAQAALQGHRLAELMPAEALAANLANQGAQMGLTQQAQLFPGQLQAQGLGLNEAAVRNRLLGLNANNQQFMNDNAWWLAPLNGLTQAAPGALTAIGNSPKIMGALGLL